MNDKKEEKIAVKFEVIATKKDIVFDKLKNLTPGYIIHYITERGSTGSIEIPEKEYSKDLALKLIEEDVKKLDELF
ncbi:hypothetical protein ES705_48822 [subsurface metagenome]